MSMWYETTMQPPDEMGFVDNINDILVSMKISVYVWQQKAGSSTVQSSIGLTDIHHLFTSSGRTNRGATGITCTGAHTLHSERLHDATSTLQSCCLGKTDFRLKNPGINDVVQARFALHLDEDLNIPRQRSKRDHNSLWIGGLERKHGLRNVTRPQRWIYVF